MICCVLCKKKLGTNPNPPFLATFFHEFLQPDVYIPHPPVTMNSLRKQIYFLPNDTSCYALSTKK